MNKNNDDDADETGDKSNITETERKDSNTNFEEATSKITAGDNELSTKHNTEDEAFVLFVGNINEDNGASDDSVKGDSRRKGGSVYLSEAEEMQSHLAEQVNKISQRLELFDASITEDLCIDRMKEYEQLSSKTNISQNLQDTFESKMPSILSSNNLSSMRSAECCTQSINEETHSTETMEQEPMPQQPETLEPNNPLMARYQAALQAHLLRQNKKLDKELIYLEGALRQKQKEREHISLDIYNTQQAVNQQHIMLDKKKEEFVKVIDDRDKLTVTLNSEKNILNEKATVYFDTEKKVEDMRQEKEALSLLISQFMEWEEVQNSQIKISQRMSEKQRMDKDILTQEKLRQDMLMLTLATEVLKLNKVFDDLEKNIKDKQADVTIIAQSVTDGTVDLEEVQNENKHLLETWNNVIFRIEQRDKALVDVKKELQNVKDQFHTLECQIDSFKRSTKTEIKRNGQLSITLNRIEEDFETLQRVYAGEEEKQKHLKENFAQLINMIELTKKDLNLAINEWRMKDKEKRNIQYEIDRHSLQKYSYEEELLNILHNQKITSQTDKHATKLLSQLHNNCRKQEISLATFENDLAKVLLDIEEERKIINSNLILIEEEKLIEQDRDEEVEMMETTLQNLNRNVIRKQGQIDSINNKLSEIKSKTGGFELSADERQISSLEKAIIENDQNVKKLQGQWVREQRNIVNLTHQHNQQLHQINIYRKQLLVLDQKYMKMETEIEKYKKDESNTLRAIDDLQKKLVTLNQQCSEKKNYKDLLDNENFAAQNQLICDLKDAEISALSMLTEMCNLEIEKDELRKKLSESQRECLAWEKKLQLAVEMKTKIEKAKGEGGDIAVMKAEIHRMEVRLAQLHKAQEKLAQDMEMCIIRRDGILDSAHAKEKRSVKGIHYTRQQLTKKLDDLRNKIKQTELEIKSVFKKISDSAAKLSELKGTVNTKKQQLEGLQEAASQMQSQINEGHLHRQGNLELLVYRQRKIRFYGDLKCGRYNLFYRNDTSLELTAQKQKAMNTDLVSVVEYLTTDFPSVISPLKQILSTLHLQTS